MKTSFTNTILNTTDSWEQLVIRVTLAMVIWPHGAQFLLGWFGGFGFTNSIGYLTGPAGLPWLVGFMVIMIQFFGSLMLLLGCLTRVAALGMLGMGIGMIFSGHIEHGFFMNWAGNQKGEGFEYHLLMLGMSLALIIGGGGRYAFDKTLSAK